MRNMEKGFMAQLINKVRNTGLGAFPVFTTWEKSILTIMGYIIKKRQMAMGRETWARLILSNHRENEGKTLPRRIPAIIHKAIHPVRYFSNILNPFFCIFPFDTIPQPSFVFSSDTFLNK